MDQALTLYLSDEAATEQLGRQLAGCVRAPALIFLRGDLGAGKTTISRGFIQASGHPGAVKSPTYTLIEPYELGTQRIFHLDLYRLADAEELEYLGLDDLLGAQAILLVEWPERGSAYLPAPDLEIELRHQARGRQAVVRAHSAPARAWLAALAAHFGQESHLQD